MARVTAECREVRLALGAHALGSLDPAEGRRVAVHLAGCPDCRAELEMIAGLPAMLDRVSAAEVTAAAEASPPAVAAGARVPGAAALPPSGRERPGSSEAVGEPGGLLERTLEELRRRRGRARLRLRIALVTAGLAVLAAGGAAAGIVLETRAAPPAAAVARASAADAATGVVASAEVYAETWGSTIRLRISGVTPGQSCELVTVARDGSEEVAGTWKVGYTGGVEVSGVSGTAPGRIVSLRVVTISGSVLVTLPVARAARG